MIGLIRRAALTGMVAAVSAVGLAGTALAVPQHLPAAGDKLHSIGGGGPGALWNTGGLLVPGSVSYDSGTGNVTITGTMNQLNWYNPALPAPCASDAQSGGVGCQFNYSPNLDLSMQAELTGFSLGTPIGFIQPVIVELETLGTGMDITLTDPSDGNSVMLEAAWQSGLFNGTSTTGLSLIVNYNTSTGEALIPAAQSQGFMAIDPASPYASLFGNGNGIFGISLATVDDFDCTGCAGGTGDLGDIIDEAIGTGTVPSFDSEANGSFFAVDSGDFVIPEPATGLLVGLGLSGLAAASRRRS